jgi:hypothetical protein
MVPPPSPACCCQMLTESRLRNETYLLTPELIRVDISGPREGRTDGKRDKAYRRRLAVRESSSLEVEAWVYPSFWLWAYDVDRDDPESSEELERA